MNNPLFISKMDWIFLCSVHNTRNIFRQHFFSPNVFMRSVMFLFMVHVSHPYVAVGNIIRNFILLFVTFHNISILSMFACHCQPPFDLLCIPSPSALINEPIYILQLFTIYISSSRTLTLDDSIHTFTSVICINYQWLSGLL